MKKVIFVSIIMFSFGFINETWAQSRSKSKNLDTAYIEVSSRCGQCKQRIEKALAYEKGLKDFHLDLETHQVYVVYNPQKTNLDRIRKAITKVGYDADGMPADPDAYAKLPKCCQKDAAPH